MIVRDGIPFIFGALVLTALLAGFLSLWWLLPGGILVVFFLNFFRNPQRQLPAEEGIVSPADGKIVAIRRNDHDNGEESGYFLSIFMNPFDVHVNRAPIAGRITGYEYFSGKFKPAFDDSATMDNERNLISMSNEQCTLRFSQVAGILARRIVFWKKPGDLLDRGERIGLIRFGSRVDMWLPADLEIMVRMGQKVKAASTLLAKFSTTQTERKHGD